jgi:hypothetical protein
MTFEITSSNILEVEMFEGVVTTTPGTAIVPHNSNRTSANVSQFSHVYKDAYASTTYATVLLEQKYGANTNKTSFGGSYDGSNEIILDSDKVYYWKFTSGADSNIVSFCGYWYEH